VKRKYNNFVLESRKPPALFSYLPTGRHKENRGARRKWLYWKARIKTSKLKVEGTENSCALACTPLG